MGRAVGYPFRISVICITLFFSLSSWGNKVGLLVDTPSAQITAFEKQLNTLLPTYSIQQITSTQLNTFDTTSVDKWITLGPNALSQLMARLQAKKVPVLALFLPETARLKLSAQYQQGFTTLENAPDMAKQLALIHALVPQARQVGVFHSSQYKANHNELDELAKKYGLKLHWSELKDPLDWDRHALKVLGDVDLVLGVNDDALYNTTTIRSILMRLYRSGKALIGPDKGYVRAGAVASTYAGIEETLLAAADWIRGELPAKTILENPYFNISVNAQVARSLNIVVDDALSLVKQVKESTDER
jgi:ABC-type uncharacterized transport system substrate-binding protein